MTASFKIGFLNSIRTELIVLPAGPEVLTWAIFLPPPVRLGFEKIIVTEFSKGKKNNVLDGR